MLKGGEYKDTFIYSGGKDTIDSGYGAGDIVSLSGFSPITNGLKLSKTTNDFVLKFDDDNTLQFNAEAASITSGSDTYVYTPTAISMEGGKVTLGSSYDSASFAGGTTFTTINAAAVSLDGSFTVTGKTDGGNYIVGSNYVQTSILGGSSDDTLKAGTAGATLNGNGGADLLIGGAENDTLIANGTAATINGGAGSNVISVNGGTATVNVSDGSDTINVASSVTAISVVGLTGDDLLTFSSTISNSLPGDGTLTLYDEANSLTVNGVPTNGTTQEWSLESGVATFTSISTSNVGYSIEGGNSIRFTGKVAATGTPIFKLGGIQSTNGIKVDSSVISLGADNFGASGASILSASGYKFSLTGGDYNNTFTGSGSADSIYNAGNALLITGGNGNDYIQNVSGTDVTLGGGTGNDTLVGNATKAETFDYTAGNDKISGFGAGDLITTTLTPISDLSKVNVSGSTYTFNFGTNNTLTVDGATVPVSVKKDSDTYVYTASYIAKNTDGVTLKSAVTLAEEYSTIDASAVTAASEINGNTKANYIIGSATAVNSLMGFAGNDELYAGKAGAYLDGGADSDLLVGAAGKDTFVYNGGSDTIQSYTAGNDSVIVADDFTLPTTFNTAKTAHVNYDKSNYVISFGGTDSLTFKATNAFAIVSDGDTYSYTTKTITKNAEAITLGSAYTSNYNGANTNYVTINAAEVTSKIRITGNSQNNYIVGGSGGGTLLGGAGADSLVAGNVGTFLNGGAGDDSLVGGTGNDTFAYTGGDDRINDYRDGDLVSVAAGINVAAASVSTDNGNLILDFDGSKLTFEEGANSTVSLKSGKNYYTFKQDQIALGKSITLTANYTPADGEISNSLGTYDTVNAAAVTAAISIEGNANDNYIAIGKAGGSLYGGAGNDTLVGGDGKDKFYYTAGNDVIQGYGEGDSLTIDTSKIAKARVGSRKLTFTMTDKANTLVFRSDDSIPAQISLTSGGYLTQDGVVKDSKLDLFASAKGRMDYGEGVTSIDASAVDKQSVTLVGGSQGGLFTFKSGNKKRDGFEYNGGAVSISGYEAGKDKINLGNESIVGFSTVEGTSDVIISLSSSDKDKFISLQGAKGSEVLIHQSTNRGNSYSKMAFADTGVLYDKATAKATSATLWSNADDYTADGLIKKITLGNGVHSISATANAKANTMIDASAAGTDLTLVGGAKNDKFTGSSNADTFVYSAGKDIIQSFGEADSISLGNNLNTAKISAGSRSIKFKFDSKNVLTVKAARGDKLSGTLTIDGKERTYGKNSIADGSNVSLTSKFGGTYKVAGDINYVDGHLTDKKLTVKGTTEAETILGGANKTLFKGAGGADSLVGGSGEDTFFYARGDASTVQIADFDFDKDKLKIASGTLAKVSSIQGGVQFAMKNGRGDSPAIGWFNVTSFAEYNKSGDKTQDTFDASKTLIKANGTYYWFADGNETLASSTDDSLQHAKVGDLITSASKINNSQTKGYDIIELNYSTNLIKSEVAVQVKDTLKAKT